VDAPAIARFDQPPSRDDARKEFLSLHLAQAVQPRGRQVLDAVFRALLV
jgi:hypothetical protein